MGAYGGILNEGDETVFSGDGSGGYSLSMSMFSAGGETGEDAQMTSSQSYSLGLSDLLDFRSGGQDTLDELLAGSTTAEASDNSALTGSDLELFTAGGDTQGSAGETSSAEASGQTGTYESASNNDGYDELQPTL
jgi:hypothetical protein